MCPGFHLGPDGANPGTKGSNDCVCLAHNLMSYVEALLNTITISLLFRRGLMIKLHLELALLSVSNGPVLCKCIVSWILHQSTSYDQSYHQYKIKKMAVNILECR